MREPGHTRERLLDVALDLFTRHGYEATSLQQIADHLGVTKAALYYYFPAKRDILRALIEPMIAELEARLDQAEAQVEARLGQVEAGVGAAAGDGMAGYLDFLFSQQRVLAFMHQDSAWLADMGELHARHRAMQTRLARVLVGKRLDLDARVRFTVAMAGVRAAVALYPDADPRAVRASLLSCTAALLEPSRQERGREAAPATS